MWYHSRVLARLSYALLANYSLVLASSSLARSHLPARARSLLVRTQARATIRTRSLALVQHVFANFALARANWQQTRVKHSLARVRSPLVRAN